MRQSELMADAVTSFMLCHHTHYLHCHGEHVEEEQSLCVWEAYTLVHFLYSDSVTFLEFCFCFTEKKKTGDKAIRRPRGLLLTSGSSDVSWPIDLYGQINLQEE